MEKLARLEGNWSGQATVIRGTSAPIHVTQTVRAQSKLDGLLMVIEGASIDEKGTIVYRTFTTLSFDDVTHQYRCHSYRDGYYNDAELTVVPDGYSWGFPIGPIRILTTMHLTPTGEWAETTESISSQRPPIKIVDFLLKRHQ